jgi:hypothetical protein
MLNVRTGYASFQNWQLVVTKKTFQVWLHHTEALEHFHGARRASHVKYSPTGSMLGLSISLKMLQQLSGTVLCMSSSATYVHAIMNFGNLFLAKKPISRYLIFLKVKQLREKHYPVFFFFERSIACAGMNRGCAWR